MQPLLDAEGDQSGDRAAVQSIGRPWTAGTIRGNEMPIIARKQCAGRYRGRQDAVSDAMQRDALAEYIHYWIGERGVASSRLTEMLSRLIISPTCVAISLVQWSEA